MQPCFPLQRRNVFISTLTSLSNRNCAQENKVNESKHTMPCLPWLNISPLNDLLKRKNHEIHTHPHTTTKIPQSKDENSDSQQQFSTSVQDVKYVSTRTCVPYRCCCYRCCCSSSPSSSSCPSCSSCSQNTPNENRLQTFSQVP